MQQTLYDIKVLLHDCLFANARICRGTQYPVFLCAVRGCLMRLTENMKACKNFKKELQALIVKFTNLVAAENTNTEVTLLAATELLNEIKQLQILKDLSDITFAKENVYDMHTYMYNTQENIQEADDFSDKFACVTQPITGTIVHHFTIKSHMYLRTLLQAHCTTRITNLHEFTNIKFYHNVSPHFVSVVLYHKFNMHMLLGDDKKTYIIKNNKLIQSTKNNKLIYWN